MTRAVLSLGVVCCLILAAGGAHAADNAWLLKVPAADRARANPYAGKPEAIRAGAVLFGEHCAACHGRDALGRRGRPSLRSEEVAQMTDGELAWILRNGVLGKGMPSWSTLPEPERWQIIAYLRSLPPAPAGATSSPAR